MYERKKIELTKTTMTKCMAAISNHDKNECFQRTTLTFSYLSKVRLENKNNNRSTNGSRTLHAAHN